MPDDGYGEFGGNGSVQWAIECSDPVWTIDAPINPQGRRQEGKDNGGNQPGDVFTIGLKIPAGTTETQFRTALRTDANWVRNGNRLEFKKLPIESNPSPNPRLVQIRISWPKRH